MAEKAQEVIDAFPKHDDWYVAEKALRWLQDHKKILLEALTLYYKTNNPSPQISNTVTPKEVP